MLCFLAVVVCIMDCTISFSYTTVCFCSLYDQFFIYCVVLFVDHVAFLGPPREVHRYSGDVSLCMWPRTPIKLVFIGILSLPSTVLRFYSIVVIAIARMTIKMKKKIIEIMLWWYNSSNNNHLPLMMMRRRRRTTTVYFFIILFFFMSLKAERQALRWPSRILLQVSWAGIYLKLYLSQDFWSLAEHPVCQGILWNTQKQGSC